MKTSAPILFLSLLLLSPFSKAEIIIDSQVLSLADLEAKGIAITALDRFYDWRRTPVIVSADRNPVGARFVSMAITITDHPIDAAYCKEWTHKSSEIIRKDSSRNSSWRFSVSAKDLDRGFLVVTFGLPDDPRGVARSVRYCLLLCELRKAVDR
jgi:hypothetical protein